MTTRVRARSETLRNMGELSTAVAVIETKLEHAQAAIVTTSNSLTKMTEPRGTGLAWAGIGLTVLLTIIGASIAVGRYPDRAEVATYDTRLMERIEALRTEVDQLGNVIVELRTVVTRLDKQIDALQAQAAQQASQAPQAPRSRKR